MMRKVSAFCLDVHARYQCQHSGACCESWSVPAEPAVVEIVRARRIRRHDVTGELFLKQDAATDGQPVIVARDTRGGCVFFDRDAGRVCVIHRDAGEGALPSACRHFPRKVLHDSRGTLISLSHFCPTAAQLLLTSGALSIVEAHPPLRLQSNMEGLDAADALPPLLRPGLLCDMEGYDAWERAGVAIFANPARRYTDCLDGLAAATERVRQWIPGAASLRDHVVDSYNAPNADASTVWCQDRAIARIARLTTGAAGDDLRTIPRFDDQWNRWFGVNNVDWFDQGMKHYLAARLFGNWVAYQGQGLRSIVEWLRTCAAMVRHFLLRRFIESDRPLDRTAFIDAIRSTDLLLLHVLDSTSFARDVAVLEH